MSNTYLLLNLACAWAQGSDFESKGDNKSSSGVARIQPQAFQEPRLYTWSQTDWGIEDQAKTLNWTAHPYDEWTFSPLATTARIESPLALGTQTHI